MDKEIPKGGEIPDEKSRKVIESLEKEGHTFEDIPGDISKEGKPEVEEKLKEEAPEDKTPEEKKKGETEEIKQDEPEELEVPERQGREPAWKQKMKERRDRQGDKLILEKLDSLTNDINEIKKGSSEIPSVAEEERAKKIKVIKEKYESELSSELFDEIIGLIPKEPEKFELPEEIKTKLADLEKLKTDKIAEREDVEYADTFTEKILPLLKTDFPQATDEDIKAVKDRLKGHYFDERYINLPIEKVYNAERNDLSKQVSPETKETAEKAKKGLSGADEVVDYTTITEEQIKALPMDEQKKALDALGKKSRL